MKFSGEKGLRMEALKLGSFTLSSSRPFVVGRHYPDPLFESFPWEEQQGKWLLTSEAFLGEKKLKDIAGQSFKLSFEAKKEGEGFAFYLSAVSDFDSLIGALFPIPGALLIDGNFKERALSPEGEISLPKGSIDIQAPCHLAFQPLREPLRSSLLVQTEQGALEISYESLTEEVSWLLFRPEKSETIYLGAVTSQNPWRPNLTASAISLRIKAL